LIFNILDHICTTCFVFANSFGKIFSKSFANSQRYMNKIARSLVFAEDSISLSIYDLVEIRLKFLPMFQMLFL
jgi:hypothetical protein